MARIEDAAGQTVEGLPVPNRNEFAVRTRNARRVARRRQAAALALEVGRTQGEDLDRFGERRQVGGVFEEMEAVPDREVPEMGNLSLEDLASFFSALSFDPRQEDLGTSSFISSFAPFLLGLNDG
jgi:hypothetical protein